MAYATVSQVKTITGVELSTSAIARAQVIIEMFSNRTEAASGDMRARDLEWLKRATSFQAAYMDAHPELLEMMDVDRLSQGDLSVGFNDGVKTMIAPLARMACKRVSWMKTRSIKTNSDFQRGSIDYDKANDDYIDSDEAEGWDDL